MPSICAKHFGALTYELGSVLHFPEGLPAFEQEKEFIAVDLPYLRPMVFLQSLKTPSLCFITMPLQVVAPEYPLELPDKELKLLGFSKGARVEPGKNVTCLAVVSVSEQDPPTANLLAPIVLNTGSGLGIQSIQTHTGYSHRVPLQIANTEVACL